MEQQTTLAGHTCRCLASLWRAMESGQPYSELRHGTCSRGQRSACSASLHVWKVAPQSRWQLITGQDTLGSTGTWQWRLTHPSQCLCCAGGGLRARPWAQRGGQRQRRQVSEGRGAERAPAVDFNALTFCLFKTAVATSMQRQLGTRSFGIGCAMYVLCRFKTEPKDLTVRLHLTTVIFKLCILGDL